MRKSIVTGLLALVMSPMALAQAGVSSISFGSCAHQDKPMPILKSINGEQPDVFLFLGDNVYADTRDMSKLAATYDKLGANKEFKKLVANSKTMAIWDDHDFGENDAGKEYPPKEQSRQIMLDFWNVAKNSERRTRADGIYTSHTYGEGKQSIQVIMPDLRWNRDELKSVSKEQYQNNRAPKNIGPYIKHSDSSKSMLGEAQWRWLEKQLQKPARIKIIASSLQLIPDFTGWESWANFPGDRQRLFKLIKKHKVNGVILISGDTHWGEVSYYDDNMDYPLWEITSSGLTQEWKQVSPNKHRVGQPYASNNYGTINIDWEKSDPLVSLQLKDVDGNIVNQHSFRLSELEPYKN